MAFLPQKLVQIASFYHHFTVKIFCVKGCGSYTYTSLACTYYFCLLYKIFMYIFNLLCLSHIKKTCLKVACPTKFFIYFYFYLYEEHSDKNVFHIPVFYFNFNDF